MNERLKKLLTRDERYFCWKVLCNGPREISFKIESMAKLLNMSPGTMRNVIRLLVVADYITYKRGSKSMEIKVKRPKKIKELIEGEFEK